MAVSPLDWIDRSKRINNLTSQVSLCLGQCFEETCLVRRYRIVGTPKFGTIYQKNSIQPWTIQGTLVETNRLLVGDTTWTPAGWSWTYLDYTSYNHSWVGPFLLQEPMKTGRFNELNRLIMCPVNISRFTQFHMSTLSAFNSETITPLY